MKKKSLLNLTGIIILFNIFSVFSQTNEWKTLNENGYSIEFPKEWKLNKSGQNGTSFVLLTELNSKTDKFNENINLLIQDLTAYKLDLNQYVEISEKQIKEMMENGKIVSSERLNKNGKEFQKVIFTGKQGIYNLKFEQLYWVLNNKAYVLTLTCENSEFEKYKEIAEKILNSFNIIN